MYIVHRIQVLVCLIALGWGTTTGVLANPRDYPQFAQQQLDTAIPIAFITAEIVKQRLADGTPQLLVDVRKRASYDAAHLPGAVSMPLQELPTRMAEIPHDVPVVLY
jgi:hypothetical protein